MSQSPPRNSSLKYHYGFLYFYSRPLLSTVKDLCTTLSKFDVTEANTDATKEVNATLHIEKYDRDSKKWITFKTYQGKSTRPLKKTRKPKNEKEIMEEEAKKAALVKCVKEHFEFNKFDDWCVDELGRVIDIEKQFQL